MIKVILLQNSCIYNFLQKLTGADKWRKIILDKYFKITSGMRVLDLCCGTAAILQHLGQDVHYLGIDFNKKYIATATKTYTAKYKNAKFICADINTYEVPKNEKYDRVLMMGAMHHLNDKEVGKCLTNVVKYLLKENGRFCSLDGVYLDEQSFVSRFLLNHDRGKYVRKKENWILLVKKYIPLIKYIVSSRIINNYDIIIFY